MSIMLAQVIDPLSGGAAGWSAFGLAGLILAWLFLKHLPAKDAQLAEKDAKHLAHVHELVTNFTTAATDSSANFTKTVTDAITSFSKEQQYERDQCLRLHAENMAEHRAAATGAQTRHHELRNLFGQLILNKAVEDAIKHKAEEKQ